MDDDETCWQCFGEGGWSSCMEDCCPAEGGEEWCTDLNAWGQFWTDDTFRTPRAAWKHLREYWDQPGFEDHRDISRFQVVPVVLNITETLAPDGSHLPQSNDLAKEDRT